MNHHKIAEKVRPELSEYTKHRINSAEWEIWYQDTFDIECPRQLELVGRGLINGLIELWARHLYETIQPDGSEGFSRFNLWWKGRARSITITGDMAGQAKLRSWVFGERRSSIKNYLDIADQDLLALIAEAHSFLIFKNQTSARIIDQAVQSNHKTEFVNQMNKLLDADFG